MSVLTTGILTERDLEILKILLFKVRFFSIEQVARTWWSNTKHPTVNALKRLSELQERNYVTLFTVVAHPEIPLQEPYFCWSPGADEPDFGSLAYQLSARWSKPYGATKAVIATPESAEVFGGSGGKFPKTAEQTHDLHLASLYLRFRKTAPDRAVSWIHEDQLKRPPKGVKTPDAFLIENEKKTVIEIAGKYPKKKLHAFHEHCATNELPYELW